MATIIYGAGNDRPGTITVDDDRAIEVTRDLVRDGYRNQAWATVELPGGRVYQACNRHGRVVARYLEAPCQ